MINAKRYQKYAESPSAFRNDLLVDVDGSVVRFGDCMDDWQAADFAAIDPGLQRCNGRADSSDAKGRVYLERGRGHSKTTDLAITCTWALAFAARPIKAYGFAADQDQANLLKQAMETVVRLNPWLAKIIEVGRNCVTNIAKGHPGNGSRLEIFTSDVGSSYGILPDLIVADELVHWEGDGSLWHSIISSAAKRSNCLLAVISNAGFVDSWQWQVREAARTSDDWIFSRLDGPVASWFTPERLEEQRRMLPAVAFARLWGNAWSSGGGDALTPDLIRAAFDSNLQPMEGKQDGWAYVAGVDLALVRDFAAVCVLAVKPGQAGKIRLASHRLWRPALGKKINLIEVEKHLVDLHQRFELEIIAFDPWNAEHLAQSLRTDLLHRDVRDIPPTAATLREIATLTIEFFQDHRVQLFDCEPLRRDLQKLRVEERANNSFRLVSPRDGDGHGDSFSAFSLALLVAHELAGDERVSAGPIAGDYDPLRAFEMRAAAHLEEQKRLAALPTEPETWIDALVEGKLEISTPINLYSRPSNF